MRNWFGMEAAAHATEEGGDHAAAPAEGEGEAVATTDHAAAPAEGDHAAAGHAAAGVAPKGAVFLHPDNHVIHAAHEAPNWVKVSPFVAMLIGFAMAWLFYIKRPDLPGRLAAQQRGLYQFLLNKWYFDELYNVIFVKPAFWLGRQFWKIGDIGIIDRFGPNGVAWVVDRGAAVAHRFQNGYVYSYALVMLLGLVAAITWVVF